MNKLRELPEGTFGHAYTRFMDSRQYTPGIVSLEHCVHLAWYCLHGNPPSSAARKALILPDVPAILDTEPLMTCMYR